MLWLILDSILLLKRLIGIPTRFVCLIRPDGRKYEGGWLDGKQHGKATYTNAQKKVRVGIWQNGKRLEWVQDTAAAGEGDQGKPAQQID